MHPDFQATDARSRQRLGSFLSELPWGWPEPSSSSYGLAQKASGRADAPPIAPGEVLLLTERLGEGSLWVLRLQGGQRGDVALDTEEGWLRAAELVPTTLPLLWQSPSPRAPHALTDPLRPLPARPPRLRRAHAPVRSDESSPSTPFESVVGGDSLGAALLLAQASLLVETPVAPDLAITATLGPTGELGPVAGLQAKLLALVRLAPRVRRLIVAASQQKDAERIVEPLARANGATTPTILGLATSREAVRVALPDAVVAETWRRIGAESDRRGAHVERLLQLALAERSECADWRPVETAASVAAKDWEGLAGHELWSIHFAAAVAARHMGRAAERSLPLPARDELLAIPQPRRARILAHLVQQSADTGDPPPSDVDSLATGQLATGADAFPDHIRLAGARGRLAAALRRDEDALALQRAAAEAWLARPEFHDQVTYPLSEIFRLAVVLHSPATLDLAEDIRRRAIRSGAVPTASPWIEAPRARALVALRRPRAEAMAVIEPLLRAKVPAHCGHAARRSRRALAVREGEPDVIASIDAELVRARDVARDEAAGATSAIDRVRAADLQRDIETCMALTLLDAAGEGERAQAEEAVQRLRALHPSLCAVLLSDLLAGQWAEALRRRFPY